MGFVYVPLYLPPLFSFFFFSLCVSYAHAIDFCGVLFMSFSFVPASDPRTRFIVDIPTPDGEVFTFDVPLMSFMDRGVFEDYMKWADKNTDEALLKARKRPSEEAFDWFMQRIKPENWDYFAHELVFGEKEQLWNEWNRLSSIPLGESLASASS